MCDLPSDLIPHCCLSSCVSGHPSIAATAPQSFSWVRTRSDGMVLGTFAKSSAPFCIAIGSGLCVSCEGLLRSMLVGGGGGGGGESFLLPHPPPGISAPCPTDSCAPPLASIASGTWSITSGFYVNGGASPTLLVCVCRLVSASIPFLFLSSFRAQILQKPTHQFRSLTFTALPSRGRQE